MKTQEKPTESTTIESAIASVARVVDLLRDLEFQLSELESKKSENELFKAVLVDILYNIARSDGDQKEVLERLATVIKEDDRAYLTDRHRLSIRIF